ncbi:MAG: hypothetical protein ABL907_05035 [Hyphomicrobium sp.]
MQSESTTGLAPHEAWTKASMAATSAAMDIAMGMTAATTAFWSRALSSDRTDDPPAQTNSEQPSRAQSNRFAHPRSETASEATSVKSWYRAPYRSPFDPAFWLIPGHPVDHMGDWLGPMQRLSQVRSANDISAGTPADAMNVGAYWLAPWLAWAELLERTADVSRASAKAEPSSLPASLDIFDAAFSAYRSAGGHAVAQIVSAGALGQSTATAPAASALAPWPFGMFGWSRS